MKSDILLPDITWTNETETFTQRLAPPGRYVDVEERMALDFFTQPKGSQRKEGFHLFLLH